MTEILLLLAVCLLAAIVFFLVQIREGVATLCIRHEVIGPDDESALDFGTWSERNLPGGAE